MNSGGIVLQLRKFSKLLQFETHKLMFHKAVCHNIYQSSKANGKCIKLWLSSNKMLTEFNYQTILRIEISGTTPLISKLHEEGKKSEEDKTLSTFVV